MATAWHPFGPEERLRYGRVGPAMSCEQFWPGLASDYRHDSRSGAGDATECVAGGTAKILDNSPLCTHVHLCIHSYTDEGVVIPS